MQIGGHAQFPNLFYECLDSSTDVAPASQFID